MSSVTTKGTVGHNLPSEKQEVCGTWTGGGAAANCSKADADHSAGITSVAYDGATGKYVITLKEWGQQLLPGSHIEVHRAAGAAPLVVNIVRAITVSGDSATVNFEVWDMATPSLVDLETTDTIGINLAFSKTKPVV